MSQPKKQITVTVKYGEKEKKGVVVDQFAPITAAVEKARKELGIPADEKIWFSFGHGGHDHPGNSAVIQGDLITVHDKK